MEWILGLLGLLIPTIITVQNNRMNRDELAKVNEKNESLMREQWEMESIGHKMQEYKDAGLSPLLATGINSSYSTPIQVQAHKQNTDVGSIFQNALSMFSSANLYKQQKLDFDAQKLDNDYKAKQVELIQKQIEHFGESPELKNLEYVWSKLEEHWPNVARQISSWLGIKDPSDMKFDEIFTTPEEKSGEISGMRKLTEESGIVSMSQQQTIEGLIEGFVKQNGKVPKQVLSRFVDPIAEAFNVDVADLIKLYYSMLDE